MIEPYATEKQCSKCEECKPLSAFSPLPRSRLGVHSICKKCRSARQGEVNKLKTRRRNAPARPVVWERKITEALLDVRLRKWATGEATRLPVFGGGFGAAVIGRVSA